MNIIRKLGMSILIGAATGLGTILIHDIVNSVKARKKRRKGNNNIIDFTSKKNQKGVCH